MAPLDKLAELRMAMAGEQLGGKIGYDVLDEEQPFGVSAVRAKMNETRAIEGELSKSIQSHPSGVGAARASTSSCPSARCSRPRPARRRPRSRSRPRAG